MSDVTPRVLVVDDERFYREAITETLVHAGFSCEAAENGEAALGATKANDFGAVVLDVGLSSPSGVDVLKQLLERQPAIRVVVLATQAEHEAVLEALRLGACDYLAKPLHDEELGLAVKRALAGHAVELRWEELRERICALDARENELVERAAECGSEERVAVLGNDIAETVSVVLGAAKASLMLMSKDEGRLRVVAACGHASATEAMDPVVPGEGVAGRAFREAAPFLVDDLETDERFSGQHPGDGRRVGAVVVAPIPGEGGPIGVLCAADPVGRAVFGAQDLALLRVLARQVGALLAGSTPEPEPGSAKDPSLTTGSRLSTAEIASENDESPDDAELARTICEVITTELEPDRLIESALGAVARLVPASPVALHLIDGKSGLLVLEGQVEGTGSADRNGLGRGGGLTGMVVQTGQLVATGHPEKDPRFEVEIDTPSDGSVRPLICVPIRVRGKILGVLRAFPHGPESARASTAEILAASVSAAVRNVLLYRNLLDSIDEVARARRANRGRM